MQTLGVSPANNEAARATAQAIERLLDKLDARDARKADANRRQNQRCVFRRTDVLIRIHHPGGTTSARAVATRNLSANGIGFLCNSFVHLGTRIEIVLKRRVGGDDVIHGRVMFCGHVGGVFHQVGVKFDNRIFPKLYLDPGSYEQADFDVNAAAASLRGRLLYLDDQEMDRNLVGLYLKGTHIDYVGVDQIVTAVEAIKSGKFDVVLSDLNLENESGEAAIKALREAGHDGPIAMVTGESTPARLKAAMQAGAIAVLVKPFPREKLIAALASWLGAGVTASDPIYSTMEGDADMAELIGKFVEQSHTLARSLQDAFEGEKLDRVRQLAVAIKGSSGGYGYLALTDAAADAIKSLDSTASLSDSAVEIQRLIELCQRTAAKKPA
jgi:two-component system chemotaxis response regulator CheY